MTTVPAVSIDAHQLLDSVHDAVLIFDPDGEIVLDVNDRACETYGLTRDQFIGMSLRTISPRSDAESRHVVATLESRRYYSFETVQWRSDGAAMVLEVHALPIEWDGRRAILSVNRDISERVRMLHRLEQAASEWQLTVDAVHAALALVDKQGTITRANKTAQESAAAAGLPNLVGRNLADLAHRPPWDRVAQLTPSALRNRIPASVQVTDHAMRKTWDITVTLTTCPSGHPQAVVIVRDISYSVELEASLRRSENMASVGRLVAGVAHEVRNPLFIISASLEALQSRLPGVDDTAKQLQANLRHELQRLTSLMNDLLDYAKPTALCAVIGSLEDVIEDAIATATPQAGAKDVRIINELPKDGASVLMDRLRLAQAFHNIIDNATHHSPPGSTVVIREGADSNRDVITCTIDDSGPGFAHDDLGAVFEPFFSRRPGGTGLGLSIVQRTIELHGGRVIAANREQGGARLTVELPRFC